MNVIVNRTSEFIGNGKLPVESFYLVVEKEVGDTEEGTAEMYLKLRKMLMKGLKEEI